MNVDIQSFLFIESFEYNCRDKTQQGTQVHIETNLSEKIIFLTRNQEEINQSYDDNKKADLIKHGYQDSLYSFMNNGHATIETMWQFHHSAIFSIRRSFPSGGGMEDIKYTYTKRGCTKHPLR